jgi:Ca2+-transporting ATPase
MARTAAFCVITLAQLFFSLGCRSFRHTMPELGVLTNPALLGAIGLTVVLQGLVVYWGPAARLLQVEPLAWSHWPLVLGLSLVPVSAIEITKLLAAWFGRRAVLHAAHES